MKYIIWVAAVCMVAGCSPEKSPDAAAQASAPPATASSIKVKTASFPESGIVGPKQGKVVDGVYATPEGKPICPVQGTIIASAKEAFSSTTYHGVKYYFCCGGCPDEFKAHPDKYAVR